MSNQSPQNQAPTGVEFNEASFKRKLGSAIKLLLIFCTMYFTAAVIATRDFKHIASIQIMNMPLALYLGVLVFVVGLVVTRMCLNQGNKE